MKKIALLFTAAVFSVSCFAEQNWIYKDKIDEMRGITQTYAYTTSKNQNSWQSPWDQPTSLELIVWKGQFNEYTGETPKVEAYALVPNSLISCSERMCDASIKFDDRPIYDVYIRGTPSNKVRFMGSLKGNFSEDLVKSKELTVELPFYQFGRSQFKIDVSGLDLERLK